jgi:hypothetical protein
MDKWDYKCTNYKSISCGCNTQVATPSDKQQVVSAKTHDKVAHTNDKCNWMWHATSTKP